MQMCFIYFAQLLFEMQSAMIHGSAKSEQANNAQHNSILVDWFFFKLSTAVKCHIT